MIIGCAWPVLLTWVRITVGTRSEMEQFQTAFKKVMDGTVVGQVVRPRENFRDLDGVRLPV